MATESISDLLSRINQLTNAQEDLSEQLRKLDALTEVAILSENFLDLDSATIQNYLWLMNDLTSATSQKCEEILSRLLRVNHPIVDG